MADYERSVKVRISSDKYDNTDALTRTPESFADGADSAPQTHEDHFDFVTAGGKLISRDGTVTLLYDDNEVFDGESTKTSISFSEAEPNVLTLIRDGNVSTAMVFEEGKRHISVYNTPFMPFELCISTLKVRNRLLSYGYIELDYVIDIHGVQTERTIMKISVF